MPDILVLEDEPTEREALCRIVEGHGLSVMSAGTLAEARQQVKTKFPDMILADMVLPDGTGLELLDEVRKIGPVEFIVITGNASVESAVQALQRGATDYVVKPIDVARLDRILAGAVRSSNLRDKIGDLRKELRELGRFGRLLGSSKAMQGVYDALGRVGPSDASVLITGESGTGKELAAQTIHDLSARRDKPLLAINCGAVSPNMIESELFGHERGSFTGATQKHEGYFQRANGGTLFLDEITEMQFELQVKLLRVLETGAFTRIGGEREIAADVRIIAASNRDPKAAVAAGKLREDLYYRLMVVGVHMPALRERGDDVIELAEFFLREINEAKGTSKRFEPETLDRLRAHTWPGNVRELKHAVQSAAIMADDWIPPHSLPISTASAPSTQIGSTPPTVARKGFLSIEVGATTMEEVERRLALATLAACDNNKTKAAKILGVSLKTLYNRMKAWASPAAVSEGGSDADGD